MGSFGLMLIACAIISSLSTRDRPVRLGGKRYPGLREYVLLVDTDLKYVIGLFLVSLVVNLYINPFPGMLSYINLTSVAAFLGSLPFCRRMNRLK